MRRLIVVDEEIYSEILKQGLIHKVVSLEKVLKCFILDGSVFIPAGCDGDVGECDMIDFCVEFAKRYANVLERSFER